MSAEASRGVMPARALVLACLGAVALGASGCSTVHLSQPGRTAACAQALPAAFSTVRNHGRLVGFRVVRRRGQLRGLYLALAGSVAGHPASRPGAGAKRPPGGLGGGAERARRRQAREAAQRRGDHGRAVAAGRRRAAAGPEGPPVRAVCVAVFKGGYAARDVANAPPGDHGRYAVLIILVRHATVVRTRLLDALPRPVRRLL